VKLGPAPTLAALVACAVAACAPPSDDGVVVWHSYSGLEKDALEELADAWTKDHPDAPIHLVAVPYTAFADKLTSAIPNGNGPDLFIYSHDRIGDWALGNVIESVGFWVDDATADRYAVDAIDSMAFRGQLYGLPMAVKSLALFYRTDLVAAPPATTDELVALAPALRAKDVYPLAYVNVDLYGHSPWLFGMGGRVLDEHGAPDLASPPAVAAADFAKRLVDTETVPPNTSGEMVASLFNEKMAALAISGPWFVGDIEAGVPWKVTTLPVVSATGRPAAPFLSVEGVLMSARAKDKTAAFAVMTYLAGDAAALVRAKVARQVVPNTAPWTDAALADNATLQAFRAQLDHTAVMPAEPAMRLVWTPYKTALGDILAGRERASDRLLATQREIEGYLRPEATPR
jgi:arabinogalactan oligomer / maltooligosaccharide transport system permease protein